MSLPKDLLDQLLTGYMDDALSDDERARVEQLLQSTPEIADELAQLQELSQSLKAIAQTDSAIKLENGFADRVLGAAVARAHAEGLGEDHPLVRLAEQPSVARKSTAPSSSWRLAGVLVGLAASIAIAVIALRPGPRDPEGFAQVPQPVVPTVAELIENPTVVPDPVPEIVAEPAPAVPEMIVNSDPVTPIVEDPAPQPEVVRPTTPPAGRIASSQDPVTDVVDSPAEMKPEIIASGIMILHVRRTEAGRASNAVAEAMKLASMSPATEKEITDEIAGFVNANEQPATDEKFSVLYLQAPVKQLDNFYLRLSSDEKGIESIGLSLAMDAPTMEVVNTVNPDPTLVRHASLELVSDNGVVEQLSDHLGRLPFGGLDGDFVSLANGPNPMGQILVLVE